MTMPELQTKHSPSFKYKWERLPDLIANEYNNGATLLELSFKYGTTPASVRLKLISLGVQMRNAGSGKKPIGLDASQIEEILRLDNLNKMSLSEIGKQFNVSRERIRQICLQAGHVSRRARMTKGVERAEQLVARRAARKAQILRLSELFKKGLSLEEISAIVGKRFLVADVSKYRKKFGTEMFPYRNPNHWNLNGTQKLLATQKNLV